MENFDKRLIAIMVAVLILAFAGGSWYAGQKAEKQAKQDELLVLTDGLSEEAAAPKPPDFNNIVVFVSGAVVNPGIITLPEGARIYEAVDMAGGLLPEAQVKQLPMARIIEDEETIYIPFAGEEGDEISPSISSNTSSGKVNINKADVTELSTLNGIGPALSQRIIDHRNSNGAFKDIEEIKNVSGIGDKKFEAIKDYITIK